MRFIGAKRTRFVRMRSCLRAPRRTRSRITDQAVMKICYVKRAVRASWGTHVGPRAEKKKQRKEKRDVPTSLDEYIKSRSFY